MRVRRALLITTICCAGACSNEARPLGPTPPQTAPHGSADPRIPLYENNAFQVSQGQRYYRWYGCARCHDEADAQAWHRAGADIRDFAATFRAIESHERGVTPAGAPIPTEVRWQITAYIVKAVDEDAATIARQIADAVDDPHRPEVRR